MILKPTASNSSTLSSVKDFHLRQRFLRRPVSGYALHFNKGCYIGPGRSSSGFGLAGMSTRLLIGLKVHAESAAFPSAAKVHFHG